MQFFVFFFLHLLNRMDNSQITLHKINNNACMFFVFVAACVRKIRLLIGEIDFVKFVRLCCAHISFSNVFIASFSSPQQQQQQ